MNASFGPIEQTFVEHLLGNGLYYEVGMVGDTKVNNYSLLFRILLVTNNRNLLEMLVKNMDIFL